MWSDRSHSAVVDGPRLDSRDWCWTPGVIVTPDGTGAAVPAGVANLAAAADPAGAAAAIATPSATAAQARAP